MVTPENAQEALGLPRDSESVVPDQRDGLRLWLTCTACGYAREHAVGTVYCDEHTIEQRQRGEEPKHSEFIITRRITCPKCGAVDQYELTSDAHLVLAAELIKMITRQSKLYESSGGRRARRSRGVPEVVEPPNEEDEHLAFVKFVVAGDRPMHPLEAREWYRDLVEQEPDRADLRVRYGNVLRFLNNLDDAAQQYRVALQREPANLEACANLAIIARDKGDRSEARRWIENIVEILPISRLAGPEQAEYAEFARDMLDELDGRAPARTRQSRPKIERPESPQPVGLAGEETRQLVRTTRKVGRNELCPCGSGKKYKKCCGR
jgi:hypothetical protein